MKQKLPRERVVKRPVDYCEDSTDFESLSGTEYATSSPNDGENLGIQEGDVETRSSTTRNVPSVMMTAPLNSGAELCERVRALNSAIRQAAASIVDASFEHSAVERQLKVGNNTARKSVGKAMFESIHKWKGTELEQGLLQKGLEGVMVVVCQKMLAMWSADDKESKILVELYQRKIKKEALSGYWRAMTKKAAKLSLHQTVKQNLSRCLQRGMTQILQLTGRNSKPNCAMSEGIRDICQAALELDVALCEDPTDDEWSVFHAGEDLDTRRKLDTRTTEPSDMPNDGVPIDQGHVLCPTGLGLRRECTSKSVSTPNGSVTIEVQKDSKIRYIQVIYKSKALLDENVPCGGIVHT
ncbi:hypothetical protein L218DRAFT_390610 [Marasmius fiardii PR-910]|nr:hypothetical protein L218DRAFT_390610 [Marasmius fiardii PR-910]